ncbi:hypothetical protein CYY_002990 [Polysphondylium violaceum]|uniref:Uncharacterized protein n=1 Tax=Polysphondylium violaceum TaxID=133409 RepID=A0A8J4V6B7_9MYCE|nr:hypothetical protein CYY_002990 [Polysphondylium violaceum]
MIISNLKNAIQKRVPYLKFAATNFFKPMNLDKLLEERDKHDEQLHEALDQRNKEMQEEMKEMVNLVKGMVEKRNESDEKNAPLPSYEDQVEMLIDSGANKIMDEYRKDQRLNIGVDDIMNIATKKMELERKEFENRFNSTLKDTESITNLLQSFKPSQTLFQEFESKLEQSEQKIQKETQHLKQKLSEDQPTTPTADKSATIETDNQRTQKLVMIKQVIKEMNENPKTTPELRKMNDEVLSMLEQKSKLKDEIIDNLADVILNNKPPKQ